LARGLRQTVGDARRAKVTVWRFLRRTPDTTVKAVVLEDCAALAGLVLAAAGLGLTEVTGSAVYDGIASVLIGVLLLVVAAVLAAANVSFLIGQSIPSGYRDAIQRVLATTPEIAQVRQLYTLHL